MRGFGTFHCLKCHPEFPAALLAGHHPFYGAPSVLRRRLLACSLVGYASAIGQFGCRQGPSSHKRLENCHSAFVTDHSPKVYQPHSPPIHTLRTYNRYTLTGYLKPISSPRHPRFRSFGKIHFCIRLKYRKIFCNQFRFDRYRSMLKTSSYL